MTFLQEREQYINELADLDTPPEESEADAQIRWNKLRALHREYADEIARSGMSGRQMKRRILTLIDEQWGQERTPPLWKRSQQSASATLRRRSLGSYAAR